MRILLVGDSLSVGKSSPGGVLAAYLTREGHSVNVDAKVSRSAQSYLDDHHALDPRDLAIVMLGTNDIGKSNETLKKSYGELAKMFSDVKIPVLLIGAPDFATGTKNAAGQSLKGEHAQALVEIQKGLFPFIDGRKYSWDLVSKGRSADRIHFTADGGRVFGTRLGQLITGVSKPRARGAGGAGASAVLLPLVFGLLLDWWLR